MHICITSESRCSYGYGVLGMAKKVWYKSTLSYFRDWLHLNRVEMELRSMAIGMNSTVDYTQDKHIPMIDFDVDDLERVERSVQECQEFWYLGDAHIFKTKRGFHAIFFTTIVPYGRLKMIIEYARDCDVMFKYISRYYNHRTLRVSRKYGDRDIKFVEILRGVRREPTAEERELGEMKLAEHQSLVGWSYDDKRVK
jgi:hypothetical protein